MSIREILKDMSYGPAPEDSSVVEGWLETHREGFGHFIDGAFTAPGETFEVRNPATGRAIAQVTQGTASDVDTAVKAARKAQKSWAKLSGQLWARAWAEGWVRMWAQWWARFKELKARGDERSRTCCDVPWRRGRSPG